LAQGAFRSLSRWAHGGARARALSGTLSALLLLGGCSGGVLDAKGPVAAAERVILLNALAIMLVIVIPVIIATLAFAWWFRASNTKARYLPEWAYSGRVEFVVWAIPVLAVLFLGGVAWIGSHDLDPAKPLNSKTPAIEVQVVSLDWKWLFIYPDEGVASVNTLVVPAGAPVHFSITSASVMNAFFVPQLGSMIYAMHGMATNLHLQADAPGEFHGLSTQYSGAGFSDMNFQLRAVPDADYRAWIAAARGAGPTLDAGSYAQLAKQSHDVTPFTYGVVQPKLFDAVVSQAIAPGPGPERVANGNSAAPQSSIRTGR
jgi:cytochrome o ubiquinol oxidase subunit 2